MKRTLTHLGVLDAPTPPGHVDDAARSTVGRHGAAEPATGAAGRVPAPVKAKRASAKIKSSQDLKVDRKGR